MDWKQLRMLGTMQSRRGVLGQMSRKQVEDPEAVVTERQQAALWTLYLEWHRDGAVEVTAKPVKASVHLLHRSKQLLVVCNTASH